MQEREYDNLKKQGGKKREAQEEFRLHWVSQKLKDLESKRGKFTVGKTEQRNKAVHLPFGAIVQREGGRRDPSAVKAALNHCLKSMHMGKDWVFWNPMTERVEFEYIRRSHINSFTKAWTERCQLEAPPMLPPSEKIESLAGTRPDARAVCC